MVRVLLADDHAVLRSGLRLLLSSQPGYSVVAEAGNGREALAAAERLRPDVAVADLSMPGTDAFATVRALAELGTAVVVLSMHEDPACVESALAAGASHYVPKRALDRDLISAVRAAACQRGRVSGVARAAPARRSRAGRPLASARELQALRLLAQGHTNREVARILGVAVKTAETFRARLGQKLGLTSRADIVRHALQAGLLEVSAAPLPDESRPRPR